MASDSRTVIRDEGPVTNTHTLPALPQTPLPGGVRLPAEFRTPPMPLRGIRVETKNRLIHLGPTPRSSKPPFFSDFATIPR
jgi:hypothetical protein